MADGREQNEYPKELNDLIRRAMKVAINKLGVDLDTLSPTTEKEERITLAESLLKLTAGMSNTRNYQHQLLDAFENFINKRSTQELFQVIHECYKLLLETHDQMHLFLNFCLASVALNQRLESRVKELENRLSALAN